MAFLIVVWRADSKTSVLNEVLKKRKSVWQLSPIWWNPERWPGLNWISYPDWVKICIDPNGRIKLRAKQKYEILSATVYFSAVQEVSDETYLLTIFSCLNGLVAEFALKIRSCRRMVENSFLVPYYLELLLPFPLWSKLRATRDCFCSVVRNKFL